MIAATSADWVGEPRLERDVFETTEPGRIVAVIGGFCRERLGSGVAAYEFFATSVGSVHGLRLADGRRVVLKAYRREADVDHLAAMQHVQRALAHAGFPAPRPLLAPTPIAQGIALVETLIDEGERGDAHDPAIRRAVAAGLAGLIETARLVPTPSGLVSWRNAIERLWQRPHDRRFDFAGTAQSAGWIDELAAQARRQLDDHAADPLVIGRGDWRVEHLRLQRGVLSAAYDWDSLALGPEPAFAGAAAHAFTADCTIETPSQVPQLEESLALLDDYQQARAGRFSRRDWRVAMAALVLAMAYGARCQHSDLPTNYGTAAPQPPAHRAPTAGYIPVLARQTSSCWPARNPDRTTGQWSRHPANRSSSGDEIRHRRALRLIPRGSPRRA